MATRKASKKTAGTKAPSKKAPKRVLQAAAQKVSKAVKKAKRKISRQPEPVVPAIEPPSPRTSSPSSKAKRRVGSPLAAASNPRRKASPRVTGGVNLRIR